MLTVTVDTNVLDREKLEKIRSAIEGLEIELATTTVTLRERPAAVEAEIACGDTVRETMVWGESRWDEGVWGGPVYETLTLGESLIGAAVLAADDAPTQFESILRIVGSGSFPKQGQRDSLSDSRRRQLRDAMILEAHTREGRDILVSDDVTGFGRPGSDRRQKLESLCGTKIKTVEEFCAYACALPR